MGVSDSRQAGADKILEGLVAAIRQQDPGCIDLSLKSDASLFQVFEPLDLNEISRALRLSLLET